MPTLHPVTRDQPARSVSGSESSPTGSVSLVCSRNGRTAHLGAQIGKSDSPALLTNTFVFLYTEYLIYMYMIINGRHFDGINHTNKTNTLRKIFKLNIN